MKTHSLESLITFLLVALAALLTYTYLSPTVTTWFNGVVQQLP